MNYSVEAAMKGFLFSFDSKWILAEPTPDLSAWSSVAKAVYGRGKTRECRKTEGVHNFECSIHCNRTFSTGGSSAWVSVAKSYELA